jgi:hypothetical protein
LEIASPAAFCFGATGCARPIYNGGKHLIRQIVSSLVQRRATPA